jgi:CubicO group peptidase (beta-lactamase class C family)
MHTPGTHQSWSPSRRSVVAGAALSVLVPSLVRAKSVQGQFDDVVAAFDQERQRRGVPSISVALVEEGRILLHARGFADAQRGKAASTATVYQAASISKTIGALTALSLARQGKIELDADVSTVLRQWKLPLVPQGGRGPITLRRLFGMTAGCNVPGYAGYSVGVPLPGDIAILNGDAPLGTALTADGRVAMKRGNNVGFRSGLVASPFTGQGAVVMTNGNDGEAIVDNLLDALAATFGWPARAPWPE